jgi:hypothetical protein
MRDFGELPECVEYLERVRKGMSASAVPFGTWFSSTLAHLGLYVPSAALRAGSGVNCFAAPRLGSGICMTSRRG